MSLILNIDTAVAGASIALSQDDRVLAFAANEAAKESAGWLQPAVRELMAGSGFSLSALDAIAVSAGPGSYTGLRVGMASAKGLCYALNKPLITVGTLEAMAAAAIQQVPDVPWFCPMIDARRMEVFTAIYNRELQVIVAPHNLVLDAGSFSEQLSQQQICFLGNGSDKFKPLVPAEKGVFALVTSDAAQIAALAFQRYVTGDFADLAYAEPFYIKAFYSTQTGI